MSGQFQYFVVPKHAGQARIEPSQLADYGLAYAFDRDRQPVSNRCMTGPRPDGSGGIVLCCDTSRLGYYPDRQMWRPMHGDPEVWVGIENDHRPTPLDVARSKQADGEWLTMRDDSRWLIPRARQYDANEAGIFYRESLPANLDINNQGEWIRGDVFAEYLRLWELANDVADGANSLDELATAALNANYRIGQTELALLGLLDTDWSVLFSVLRIVLDRERSEDLQKKTAESIAATSTLSAGVTQPTMAEQQDIDRQSQSVESGQAEAIGVERS